MKPGLLLPSVVASWFSLSSAVLVNDAGELVAAVADERVASISLKAGAWLRLPHTLSIVRAVSIYGPPSGERPVLDAGGFFRVIDILPGAGLVQLGRLVVTGGVVTGYGAGIHVREAALVCHGCVVRNNTARAYASSELLGGWPVPVGGGGFAALNGADATLVACSFDANEVLYTQPSEATPRANIASGGGILAIQSRLTIMGGTVSNNFVGAQGSGAGVYILLSHAWLEQASIVDNVCFYGVQRYYGGGGGVFSDRSNASLHNCAVQGNVALHGTGGGLFNTAGFMEINSSLLNSNKVNCSGALVQLQSASPAGSNETNMAFPCVGGGIFNNVGDPISNSMSTLYIADTKISGNIAEQGAGLFNNGNVDAAEEVVEGFFALTRVNFTGNTLHSATAGYDLVGSGILNLGDGQLLDQTSLSGNVPSTSTIFSVGSLFYVTPAPLGHFLFSVFRCIELKCGAAIRLRDELVSGKKCQRQRCNYARFHDQW